VRITGEQVRYVAALANLELTEDEIHRYRADLDEILEHVEKMNALDTTGVAAMAQVLHDSDAADTLRDDVPRNPSDNQAALANAPLGGAGYFKVPRVIER
jgi:aspartyl-tRNA(Asn)/glutamyl-tRNA(Gln) amidotransferase subunit C